MGKQKGRNTRAKVYFQLRRGIGIPPAANILHVSRQCVHKHALALVKIGALQILPGCKNPLIFSKGPRAVEFEHDLHRQLSEGGGRSRASTPILAARVHGSGYKWEFSSGPTRKVPWEKDWSAGVVKHRVSHFTFNSLRYRAWETRGPKTKSLIFQPEEQWVNDPERIRNIREAALAESAQAMRKFAKAYGYIFRGECRRIQGIEMGLEARSLRPLGEPGVTKVWRDKSGPAGHEELESSDPDLVASLMTMPNWKDELMARLDRVEDDVGDLKEVAARVVSMLGQRNEIDKEIAKALVAVTEHLTKKEEVAPEPPFDPNSPMFG